MFSSSCMPSDLKIYSKDLVLCSKKHQQRSNYPRQAMCWIWWGIPWLVLILHYLPLGGRSFYCSGWKWAKHALRVYLSLISPHSRLAKQSFQILEHTILHIRDPKCKGLIIAQVFQWAGELNPRCLRLCGNKLFSMLFLLLKCFPKHFAYLLKSDKGA